MRTPERVDWITAGAFLALLALLAFGLTWARTGPSSAPDSAAQHAQPQGTASEFKIRLATSKNLWCALTLVAIHEGFFQQEGVMVQASFQAAGRLNMDALLGGSVDIANVVETNLAYQALKGERDLAVHGTIVEASDYALITQAPLGIKLPGQLRGKQVAYAQATGAESFLFWFLEQNGLSASDITLRPLQPAGLVDTFLAGGADAAVAWEPFATAIRGQSKQPGTEFGPGPTGFRGLMFVATRRSWAEANSQALVRFEAAVARAATFVAEQPAKSKAIVSKEAGLPIATVEAAWERFVYAYLPPTEANRQTVTDVVARIRRNVAELRDKEPIDSSTYFRVEER